MPVLPPPHCMLAAAIVPKVPVITSMSFLHLCLGFPLLLFPATIPCIIVFSKPLCGFVSSDVAKEFKGALYRIWCGVNRLGDSGVKVV